ncbi:MAG TPA: hypothetical protein EYN66_07585 [Myxococcales bacterium]|nr:hypothetical protein [Myxococcales bacterium]
MRENLSEIALFVVILLCLGSVYLTLDTTSDTSINAEPELAFKTPKLAPESKRRNSTTPGRISRSSAVPNNDTPPHLNHANSVRRSMSAAAGDTLGTTPPTRDEIDAIAHAEATQLWGEDLDLYAVTPTADPNGKVLSYSYVFTTSNDAPSEKEILANLAARVSTSEVEAPFRTLEMGASLDKPPVIGYWKGLPTSTVMRREALEALETELGLNTYTFVRAHMSAAFPLMEFASPDGSVFYDPKSDSVILGYQLAPRSDRESPLPSFASNWSIRLLALN